MAKFQVNVSVGVDIVQPFKDAEGNAAFQEKHYAVLEEFEAEPSEKTKQLVEKGFLIEIEPAKSAKPAKPSVRPEE